MKKHTPISFFSFQDIITSLTGIMIVIVLIIALELVEHLSKTIQTVSALPEMTELETELAALRQKRNLLKKTAPAAAVAPDIKAGELMMSEQDFMQKIHEAEEAKRQLDEAVSELEKKLLGEQQRTLSARESQKLAEKYLASLNAPDSRLADIERKIKALRQRKAELQRKLEHPPEKVRFEFAGELKKQPILIDCTAWGFRIWSPGNEKVRVLGNPGKSTCMGMVSKLHEVIRSFDVSKFYFVLLMRESAAEHYEDIVSGVQKLAPGIEIGREAVLDGEVCF